MMLASAMHRWWPLGTKPVITDLGYYVMLGQQGGLPAIVSSGGVVVVQDIIENCKLTDRLVNNLTNQGIEVLCKISLIRLIPNLSTPKITSINDGWIPIESLKNTTLISEHAMIEVCAPRKCDPPPVGEEGSNAFWVEPRSLHPIRLKTLRRDFVHGRDPDFDRRDELLPKFDDPDQGCLVAAGHYVFGRRHYPVAFDVRNMLEGDIGDEIAPWLADICEGKKLRQNAPWERQESNSFNGDVTAVLMPLHSQIHYIWPKIANLLAQRERRQPMWLLDATLFTGRAAAYRIPTQFQYQILMAVKSAKNSFESKGRIRHNPIRILILDDAITTDRTAETILATITREVIKAFKKVGAFNLFRKLPNPIEWIRYFVILNQMPHSQHILWRNLKSVSDPQINFVLEEYAPFLGVPVYDESDCPICNDRLRIENIMSKCKRYVAPASERWAKIYCDTLFPIAIDSPGFRRESPHPLSSGLKILPNRRYIHHYADTAIWRFNELMYFSYPPGDILRTLKYAWHQVHEPKRETFEAEIRECERYRWVVLQWCLRNCSNPNYARKVLKIGKDIC